MGAGGHDESVGGEGGRVGPDHEGALREIDASDELVLEGGLELGRLLRVRVIVRARVEARARAGARARARARDRARARARGRIRARVRARAPGSSSA